MELFLKIIIYTIALYTFYLFLKINTEDTTGKVMIVGLAILGVFAYSYHKSTNKYKDILLNDYCLVERDNHLIVDWDCAGDLYMDSSIEHIDYNLSDYYAEIELIDILKYKTRDLGYIEEYNLKYDYIDDSYEIELYSYNDDTNTDYDINCTQKEMNCPANVEYLLGQINGDIHHLLVPYKLIQKLDTKPFWEGF